jgi:serine/threonine protein kinase
MEYGHKSQNLDLSFQPLDYLAANGRSTIRKVEGTEEPFLGKVYACKELRLPKPYNEKATRKVDSFKSVQHDHIVRIVATSFSEHRCTVIMEPVADTDLEVYLSQNTNEGPQERERISQWFGCLVDALAFLHGQNIVHGEINPTHILIGNNSVFLTCSAHSSIWARVERETTTRLRHSSYKLDLYEAPETSKGYPIRPSDIFSLGAVFIDMLVSSTQCHRRQELREVFMNSFDHGERTGDIAQDWMDFFGKAPEPLPWHSNLAVLCANMLRSNPSERAPAGDVRSWWSCQHSNSLPSSPCKCILPANVHDHSSPSNIKEGLETACHEGYTLTAEFLTGKSEDPVSKTARWGAKVEKGAKEAKSNRKTGFLSPGRLPTLLGRNSSPSKLRFAPT